MMICPQLRNGTLTGAMKSLSSESKAADERPLTKAVRNDTHWPVWITPAAVRSIAASPRSWSTLILPSAVGATRVAAVPQQGVELFFSHRLEAPLVTQRLILMLSTLPLDAK